MAYALPPRRSTQKRLRRVVLERIDDALGRLDGIHVADPIAAEDAVHEIRKRCKEVRGLAQLVRPALGPSFRPFDRLVRDAAAELSSIRDAHVLLGTLDRLRAAHPDDDPLFDEIRAQQVAAGGDATATLVEGDTRVEHAGDMLRAARAEAMGWKIPAGFSPLGDGLGRTYRRGQRVHAEVQRAPTDEVVHEWRKAVKHLWYQMRLLERASPSIIGPLVTTLDRVADALGDDHDLAVLIERFSAEPDTFGGPAVVDRVCALARMQQVELRRVALRSGATVYAESRSEFVERIRRYWDLTIDDGPERGVGGIEALAAMRRADAAGRSTALSRSTIERERKWLVADPPALVDLVGGTSLRQGYLAVDATVSVRVRDAGGDGCTLTVKTGRGTVRTELEWPIERDVFEQAWAVTEGRRVDKTRFRMPLGALVVEVDVFAGALAGLVMAEVEFADDSSMGAFVPPEWFGREVSDDVRYTNASLAVDGLDPSHFV